MGKFIIATDSTADLPNDYLSSNEIAVFHLSYFIGGEEYGNHKELPVGVFYNLMRSGELPKTSQVNPDEAKEGFLRLVAKSKEILYIAFSSALSGTFNSVRLAAEEVMEEDPSVKIMVLDSKSASLGEGLMVNKAVTMREEGKSMDEIYEYLSLHTDNFVHLFTVDDLNHLYRGGRVSKSTALIGTVLNIKPILHVDSEGRLVALGKERGRKKSLLKLVDLMDEQMGSYKDKNECVFISHGDAYEDAEFLRDEINSRFGIKSYIINTIGPTIGSHAGPGTVALFFEGDVR